MTAIQDNPPYRRATIVCLHASGGTGAQWTTLAEKMPPDLRVLTPDLYGHGTAAPWHGAPADIVAADTQRIGQLVVARIIADFVRARASGRIDLERQAA